MNNYIVFLLDKNTNSVAYYLDQKGDGIEHLLSYNIINKKHKILTINGDNMSPNDFYSLDFINLMQFDNNNNPTKLVVDHIKASTFFLDSLREVRNLKLQELDFIQMRAFALNKLDYIKDIESDKEALRNIINLDLFKNCKKILDYVRMQPAIIHIDYKSKYSEIFDAKN
jgi:hypothetical protein